MRDFFEFLFSGNEQMIFHGRVSGNILIKFHNNPAVCEIWENQRWAYLPNPKTTIPKFVRIEQHLRMKKMGTKDVGGIEICWQFCW